MNTNTKVLHSIWNKSADIATSKDQLLEDLKIDELLGNIFCPGPHYYYVVDFYDRQLKYVSPSISEVLGLDYNAVSFDDIIRQVHPDDISYVAKAETAVLNYLYQKARRDFVTEYKNSYCFRLKTKDGSYKLFQHQSVILTTDAKGGFAKALNIHTNISHFSAVNNYKATISTVLDGQEFVHLDILKHSEHQLQQALFSRREIEIIQLIAKGMNSQNIADTLYISSHTVKKHRVNITHKSGDKSTGELVALCIKEGLI
jgi:DNA-binding CsgD family transcriptional regulator